MSWSWEVSFFLGKFCFLPTWDLTTRGCFYHQFPSISGIGGQELSCFPVLVPWGWDVSSFSDLDALGSVHLLPSLSYIVAILNMWSSALLFLSCKILPLTDTFFFFVFLVGLWEITVFYLLCWVRSLQMQRPHIWSPWNASNESTLGNSGIFATNYLHNWLINILHPIMNMHKPPTLGHTHMSFFGLSFHSLPFPRGCPSLILQEHDAKDDGVAVSGELNEGAHCVGKEKDWLNKFKTMQSWTHSCKHGLLLPDMVPHTCSVEVPSIVTAFSPLKKLDILCASPLICWTTSSPCHPVDLMLKGSPVILLFEII